MIRFVLLSYFAFLFLQGCAMGTDADSEETKVATIVTLMNELRSWPGGIQTRFHFGGGEYGSTPEKFTINSGFQNYQIVLGDDTKISIEQLDFYLRDDSGFPEIPDQLTNQKIGPSRKVTISHETETTLEPEEEGSVYAEPFTTQKNTNLDHLSQGSLELDGRLYVDGGIQDLTDVPSGKIAAVVLHLYDLEIHGQFLSTTGTWKTFHIYTGPMDAAYTPVCTTHVTGNSVSSINTVFELRHVFNEIGSDTILKSMDNLGTDPVTITPYSNRVLYDRIAANISGTEIFQEASCSNVE